MERLLNSFRCQAAGLDVTAGQPRFGTVSSVDAAGATARVQLQPEGVLTGWLPVLSPWTGSGWGMWCPPSPGDQVLVLAQEGSSDHGVVVGHAFSGSQTAPAAASGEFWLVHSSGSALKLTNDGTVHVNGPLNVNGTVTVVGDLHVSGDVFDSHNSLSDLREKYDAHTHIDSRGGTTTTPNLQD